jgi:hypothetical protein
MWFSAQSIRLEKLLQLLTQDPTALAQTQIPSWVNKEFTGSRNQK